MSSNDPSGYHSKRVTPWRLSGPAPVSFTPKGRRRHALPCEP